MRSQSIVRAICCTEEGLPAGRIAFARSGKIFEFGALVIDPLTDGVLDIHLAFASANSGQFLLMLFASDD